MSMHRDWIDGREAARRLGISALPNVQRLAAEGLIKTRSLPGVRARFNAADVARLAAAQGGGGAPRRFTDGDPNGSEGAAVVLPALPQEQE